MRGSRLTGRGLGFCAAGLVTVGLAMLAGQPDLMGPGLFLVLVPVISLVALVVTRPRFEVSRTLVPSVVAVDAPVVVAVTVTAVASLGTGQALALDEPPRPVGAGHRFLVPSMRRGQQIREEYPRKPRRRGRWTLENFSYEVTDVLGMARRRTRVPSSSPLMVTPAVLPLPSTGGAAFGRQGETPIPQTAVSGPDDVLVREYAPRDDVRRIHWPSTARTGTLMVRREEQAWDPTAWLVVDNRARVHPATGGVRATFEWLLTAAASIGSVLLADGYEVSVTDASGATFASSTRRNPGAVGALLEHLTDADVTEDGTLARAAREVEQAPSGHLVIALLARLDPEAAHDLVATHDTRQACRAIVLPPQDTQRAHDAGLAVLLDHGWSVTTCGVGGDLAAAWAAVARPAGVRR